MRRLRLVSTALLRAYIAQMAIGWLPRLRGFCPRGLRGTRFPLDGDDRGILHYESELGHIS